MLEHLTTLEADTLERTQLEALRCWRPVENGELQRGDEIIPSVVLAVCCAFRKI